MTLAQVLAWLCACIACAGAAMTARNLRFFAALRPCAVRPERIAACVAMRDEERNAVACVQSLLLQPETAAVIVCDDDSRDGTFALLTELAVNEPRLRILRSSGGSSKRAALAACAGVAKHESCEYLLFCDADVRFDQGAAAALLAHAERENVRAVTAWPRLLTASFADTLLVPTIVCLLLCALPMWRSRSGDPRFTAGNGQIFLIEREAYERCGGHARCDAVVEDVALARALARSGSPPAFASAARIAGANGYGTWTAGARGLGRSLFASTGIVGSVAFAAWQIAAFVLPFALLLKAPVPAFVALAAAYAGRVAAARRMREEGIAAALLPLSGCACAAAALYAMLLGARRLLTWRGRPLKA